MPNETTSESERDLIPRQGTLRHVLIALGLAGIALIALYLLRNFAGALLLIFAGILLGVFLHGLTKLAVQWLRLPRALALTFVVVLLLAIGIAFFWLAGPQVFQQGRVLIDQLPQSLTALQTWLQKYDWGRAILSSLPSVNELQPSFTAILGSVSQAFSITMELTGVFVFIFFVGLYLAAAPGTYERGALFLLPAPRRARGREILAALGLALRWWLLGRVITMTLMGTLTALALWLADVRLALVLGIIAGLLLFVPYLGAIIAAIPALLVGLMESPTKALWVGVIYIGVHLFEGYCITPFVQKRAVALPPALLLSVQILAAALFGTVGVIFSTPLTVVAVVLIQTLYLQDVLGEKVAVLGKHEPLAK